MYNIERIENPRGGEFVIHENGNRMAELSYTIAGNGKITVDHTFVDAQFRGENMGKELVRGAVEFAREKNLKIIPLCPYAMAQFEKHPDYQDVLVKS